MVAQCYNDDRIIRIFGAHKLDSLFDFPKSERALWGFPPFSKWKRTTWGYEIKFKFEVVTSR